MKPPISARIVEFLGDELPPTNEPERYLQSLRFAQMAWNSAIFPANCPEMDVLNTNLLRQPPSIRAQISARLGELAERKRRMYPDDFRIIVDIAIEDRKKEIIVKASHYDYRIKNKK